MSATTVDQAEEACGRCGIFVPCERHAYVASSGSDD